MALLICPDCNASLYSFRGHLCPNEKKARATALADAREREKSSGGGAESRRASCLHGSLGGSNPSSDVVEVQNSATDEAMGRAGVAPSPPEAKPKRGRPPKPADAPISRSTHYRRRKAEGKTT